jgi:hypothetical protein
MGGGRTYNWKDARKGRGCILITETRKRRRKTEKNETDNTAAATD